MKELSITALQVLGMSAFLTAAIIDRAWWMVAFFALFVVLGLLILGIRLEQAAA